MRCRTHATPVSIGTRSGTILLARHVGRIALGHAPDETFAEDLPLRRQCLAKIDELKSKPALVALARRGIGYDPEAKRAFHREARSALRVAARHLGLEPDQFDLRSNFAGPAVSGEITLHGDEIYVQVSIPCVRPGREVMFRRCKGRQDYLGNRNHFCDIAVLAAPQSFLRSRRSRDRPFHQSAPAGVRLGDKPMGWLFMSRGGMAPFATPKAYLDNQCTYPPDPEKGRPARREVDRSFGRLLRRLPEL